MSPLSVFAAGAIALGSIIAGPAAYAACEEEIAELDRRLADPGLNDRQRQVVQGMRQSADYLCGAGKEEDVRNMLDRLDTMLNAPGIGSPLPGQADTAPARSAAASKPERQIRQSTTVDAIPDKGQWIDRPEDMFQYWYHDVDFSDGKLRVLYSTSPSLEQGQAGPWTANVYVAEIAGNGETDQHRLYSKEALETVTMALLPGQDKVLVQMRALGSGKPERLEVWSIPDGNVLSSNEIPHPRGPKDERWNWAQFRAITLDGNAIFTTTQFSGRRADPPVSVSGWIRSRPIPAARVWHSTSRRLTSGGSAA